MQPYKLICADLDSTLLSFDMTLSEENKRAIHTLAERGIHFVPNSGRTLTEFPEEILQNPDIRYMIYSDGAAIYDRVTKKTEGAYLPDAAYHALLRLLGEYKSFLTVRTNGVSYMDAKQYTEESMIEHQVGKYYRDFLFQTNVPTEGFDSFCENLCDVEMICAFFADDRELEECTARIRQMGGMMIVSSMAHNIEILSEHAGKGNAMLRLAKRLGVRQEETVAVGDSTNDTDMLRAAGRGFAVSNAWEELKANADEVLPCSNNEHVARHLLQAYFS